jgi:hypothetical protein
LSERIKTEKSEQIGPANLAPLGGWPPALVD